MMLGGSENRRSSTENIDHTLKESKQHDGENRSNRNKQKPPQADVNADMERIESGEHWN